MPDVIGYIVYKRYKFALYMGLHGYIMCYFITLIGGLWSNNVLQRIYYVIIYILAGINFIIDVVVHTSCKTGFSEDMAAIILGTNLDESKEFLSVYFSWNAIIIIALIPFLFLIINKYREVITKKVRVVAPLFLLLTFVGNGYLVYKKSPHWGVFF